MEKVSLEGVPQVYALVPARASGGGLKEAIIQAFGLGPSDFEIVQSDERDPAWVVQVSSNVGRNDAAAVQALFTDLPDLHKEVIYSELARVTRVPLLRLHRVLHNAAGSALAAWYEDLTTDLEEVMLSVSDADLRRDGAQRVWRLFVERVEAVFPHLLYQLPEQFRQPPQGTLEERCAGCAELFSSILDVVRLRMLPLRNRPVIGRSCPPSDPACLLPGAKRLLRVRLDMADGGVAGTRTVFLAALGLGSRPAKGLGSSREETGLGEGAGLTGHELYNEVAKFFGQAHVQVKTRAGELLELPRPHEALLGQLPGPTDGLCVDLLAAPHNPKVGSFDHLYREILRVLGPRRFMLDQSYRLQMPGTEASSSSLGESAITTVIVIPVNFLHGKQMYIFRSPVHRQCKALLRTFEEFREILSNLASVYTMITSTMNPAAAEHLRRTCADGLPGQTPLAPFHNPRDAASALTWSMIHGSLPACCGAIGLLGGLQSTPTAHEVQETMTTAYGTAAQAHNVASQSYIETWTLLNLLGPTGLDMTPTEARRIADIYGLEPFRFVTGEGHNWQSGEDAWHIAVGGFAGMLFGMLEGCLCKNTEQRGPRCSLILEKSAKRGFAGLTASTCCTVMGRFLRTNFPDSHLSALSKKSVITSQVLVFLGTLFWALCSHHHYMEPSVMRRLMQQDLNLGERQFQSIIVQTGFACTCSSLGWALGNYVGTHTLGTIGGSLGLVAGALLPLLCSLALTGWDWYQDRERRRQMKVAALQTLGLPEPHEISPAVFKSLLAARYKLLASFIHPDKNDAVRCDTTKVFNQLRLAKDILEQELEDYQNCHHERMRWLFQQLVSLHKRERYVSQHPSGVIMNILEDGLVEERLELVDLDHHRSDGLSITTVESRSMPSSPRSHSGSQRSSPRQPPEQALAAALCGALHPESCAPTPSSPCPPSEPWVIVNSGRSHDREGLSPCAADDTLRTV